MQNHANVSKKICPHCGEAIAFTAQQCPHCQNLVNNGNPVEKGKSFTTTILLSYLLGLFGVHRIYTGYLGIGLLQLFTLGGLGVWAFMDLISISLNKYKDKNGNDLLGYNKGLGITLLLLGTFFFIIAGNPIKFSKDFSDGYNAAEMSAPAEKKAATGTVASAYKPLEVVEHHSCDDDLGNRSVCGTVVNNTNRTYGYAQVEINLYDSSGALIDSTLDNINNLEPKATWKFKAMIMDDNATTYKIKDVTGW